MFIGVSAHTYMSICVCSEFLKKDSMTASNPNTSSFKKSFK
jgi:hypothetical protein